MAELTLSIGVVTGFITGVDVVRNAYASRRRVGGGFVSGLATSLPLQHMSVAEVYAD